MINIVPKADTKPSSAKPDAARLIRDLAAAEARALDAGDIETADTCSDCITYISHTEWLGATYWATPEQALDHEADRLSRMVGALRRAA
jgi:hypothetical protein